MRVPDAAGDVADVVIGAADPQAQLTTLHYFGATAGRVANRIAGGRFELDGRTYELSRNEGANTLHGGADGFDARLWTVEHGADETGAWATFSLHSPDGDQGFPAALDVQVTYLLTPAHSLAITFSATNVEPHDGPSTVVNLCNHAYLTLDGVGSGAIDHQVLRVPAGRITTVDAELITTGGYTDVTGTPLDFREPTPLGRALRTAHPLVAGTGGLDHNWVLDEDAPRHEEIPALRLAAELRSPATGRVARFWTDRPGVQVYSANHLDGTAEAAGGVLLRQGDGLAVETQLFPGTPNHAHFPSATLAPGATDRSTTLVEFTVE